MTAFRDHAREGVLLAGGGRAILLQLAHPAIGRGVARHSEFARDALGRLHGTLAYVYAIACGTEDDVRIVKRIVDRAHAPVRGDGYSAMDPALQLWVAATLYDSAVVVSERVLGPMGEATADEVYAGYARLGTVLQMSADLWPPDRAAFGRYRDEQLAGLSADGDRVRAVATTLLSPRTLPWWLRPAAPAVRRLSLGLLPEEVRDMFAIDWRPRDDRAVRRLLAVASVVYPRLPGVVRFAPARAYLRRLRRSSRRRGRPAG